MKIKAWLIYLLGLAVSIGIGFFTNVSFPVFGYYILIGSALLGVYYLTRKLWFGKQNKIKNINN